MIERARRQGQMLLTSTGVAIGERCAQGVDRNPRYEACEEEPGDVAGAGSSSFRKLLCEK
jgi:hypothetical protein